MSITNNLAEILADPKGALCFYCLSKPKITAKTETCDESTVICPRCSVDCVYPASSLYSFEAMKGLHASRFNKTLEDLEPCSVICTVCNKSVSNVPKCFVPKPKQMMDFHDKINQDPNKYAGKSCILEFDEYKDYESDPFFFKTNASRRYDGCDSGGEPYNRRMGSSPIALTNKVASIDDARRAEEAYHHRRGYKSHDSTSDSSIEDTRRSHETYPRRRRYKDYGSTADTSINDTRREAYHASRSRTVTCPVCGICAEGYIDYPVPSEDFMKEIHMTLAKNPGKYPGYSCFLSMPRLRMQNP
ncbi:MAG: hypothetical protein ACI90V_013339 [Bacillariaceae sp.]|jgi:hypothetical protein